MNWIAWRPISAAVFFMMSSSGLSAPKLRAHVSGCQRLAHRRAIRLDGFQSAVTLGCRNYQPPEKGEGEMVTQEMEREVVDRPFVNGWRVAPTERQKRYAASLCRSELPYAER